MARALVDQIASARERFVSTAARPLASIVEYELIPMLKEYWFDEPDKVEEWVRKLREAAH